MYQFKPTPEVVWAVLTAAVSAFAQVTVAGAPPDDWRVWGIAAATAVARAVGAVVYNLLMPRPA